ncbi:MAG: TonB family protein [Bacteroidota bacterium]
MNYSLKIALCILLPLFSFSLSANKEVEVNLHFIDGYTNRGAVNCTVELYDDKDKLLATYTTDSEGSVTFKIKKNQSIHCLLNQPDKFYEHRVLVYGSPKSDVIHKKNILLYPNEIYEAQILTQEDLLYGLVKDESELKQDSINLVLPKGIDAAYPGDNTVMVRFIVQNLVYPQISIENGDSGKVLIRFVVEKNGKISHVKILKSVTREIDLEAKRIVRAMPDWSPGEVEGEKKRTRMNLPLNFQLN